MASLLLGGQAVTPVLGGAGQRWLPAVVGPGGSCCGGFANRGVSKRVSSHHLYLGLYGGDEWVCVCCMGISLTCFFPSVSDSSLCGNCLPFLFLSLRAASSFHLPKHSKCCCMSLISIPVICSRFIMSCSTCFNLSSYFCNWYKLNEPWLGKPCFARLSLPHFFFMSRIAGPSGGEGGGGATRTSGEGSGVFALSPFFISSFVLILL